MIALPSRIPRRFISAGGSARSDGRRARPAATPPDPVGSGVVPARSAASAGCPRDPAHAPSPGADHASHTTCPWSRGQHASRADRVDAVTPWSSQAAAGCKTARAGQVCRAVNRPGHLPIRKPLHARGQINHGHDRRHPARRAASGFSRALAFQPDLPPETVRETVELMRSTARRALEEVRAAITCGAGALIGDQSRRLNCQQPEARLCRSVVLTVMRSPGRPKMLRISAGSSPVLPNQCGTLVSNAATSPGPSTRS